MREALKEINGVRKRFIATFKKYGSRKAFKGQPKKTLLFVNVRDIKGNDFCDHIWFTSCKGFEKYSFVEGDNISFDARVTEYYKGYWGKKEWHNEKPISKDYKLSHPNNILKSEIGKASQLF